MYFYNTDELAIIIAFLFITGIVIPRGLLSLPGGTLIMWTSKFYFKCLKFPDPVIKYQTSTARE